MFVYLQETICGTARGNTTKRRFTIINNFSRNKDTEDAVFHWRMSMEQPVFVTIAIYRTRAVWLFLGSHPIDDYMRRLAAEYTASFKIVFWLLLLIISWKWCSFHFYIARTKVMAWLPKKVQFSRHLDYPRSIFVSVLDMFSVSSVLQMIVLKHSITKWNEKIHAQGSSFPICSTFVGSRCFVQSS